MTAVHTIRSMGSYITQFSIHEISERTEGQTRTPTGDSRAEHVLPFVAVGSVSDLGVVITLMVSVMSVGEKCCV